MSVNPGANWPASYFAPRDFEIVQPLYDLAFLLQVVPLAKKAEVSKYRSLSLGKVAHSLDSYSTGISQWINGELADQDVDYIPTPRIKKYLATILANGTLDELSSSFSESARGCSRLRSIRGLGKKIIAEFLSESPNISEKLLIKASKKSGLTGDQILAVFAGETYGTWQSAHVIPPLMRLLHTVENECKHPLRYRISGLIDEVSPIEAPFQVFLMSDSSQIDHRAVARAISDTPFFSSGKKREGVWSIQHDMGWHFELIFTESCKSDLPLLNLMSRFDPLLRDLPKEILSDLHMHTSWSDGITTPAELVAAAARSGLQYVAITDHSQSSKIQKGLKSAVWLRQSIALKNAVLNCPVLHGLEVDILRDGRLDTPAGLLNGMDIVIGSFHVGLKQSRASNTERLFKALESGQIDVIGHPTTKLVGRPGEPNYLRPPIEADWDAIIDKCVKWRVALEINCFPSRLDIGGELLKKAVDAGCWLSVGTDAHARLHLNAIKYGAAMISKYGGAKLLNSLSHGEIKEWLNEARETRAKLPVIHKPQDQPALFETKNTTYIGKSRILGFVNLKKQIPDGSTVVGLDLTAGKNKKTGVAKLSGTYVETTSLSTDQELVDYIKATKPAIVSIDSPLGLPGGKEEIDKDAGIVRVAEHDLSSVGIPAYPALIDSMKNLTLRGIRLRKEIESFDQAPKVIESYPGAAQDILSIPRKQKGLNLLRSGLRGLGLTGPGLDTNSHDEMDAITSALVGRYYESGDYEPMGIPAEAQLIVPRVQTLLFDRLPVTVISGKTGVGKSVVSRFLALNYGFYWIKTRDLVKSLLFEDFDNIASGKLGFSNSQEVTEKHLRDFGKIILEEYGQYPIRDRLIKMVLDSSEPVVIDSVRSIDDLDMTELGGRETLFWYVDCPDTLIETRWRNRNAKKKYKMKSYKPIDDQLGLVRERASCEFDNSGTLENLHSKVDDALFEAVAIRRD